MRAGKYVQQLDGYRAFISNPLPSELPVHMEGDFALFEQHGMETGTQGAAQVSGSEVGNG